MKAATLFSGIGGAACGFAQAGIEIASSIEWDDNNPNYSLECQKMHSLNFPGSVFIPKPVQEVKWGEEVSKVDLLQASPVCSNFSLLRNFNQSDETLLDAITARAVADSILNCEPDYFMLENVPGYQGTSSLETIRRTLLCLGFKVEEQIIDLANYGIPQHRKRFFLLAGRRQRWRFPEETRRLGWKEAIAGIPLEKCTLTAKQELRLPEIEVKPRSLKEGILLQRIGAGSRLVWRSAEQPCWTITRSIFEDGKGGTRSKVATLVNEEGAWNLPIRAIARLCSFPDSFRLGKHGGQGLGYAIPPRFARLCARTLP